MSISKFKSQINAGGFAHSNRFLFNLSPPAAIANSEPYFSQREKIVLFCDSTQIPGINFSSNPVRVYGETREVVYEKIYEPITVSFYVDKSMVVKKLFDSWILQVQGTTRNLNYYNDYVSRQTTLEIFDLEDQPTYSVIFYNMFPKTVAPISLDYASKDLMKLNVTFQYEYFEVANVQSNIISNRSGLILDRQITDFPVPVDAYFSNFNSFQDTINTYSLTGQQIASSLRTAVRDPLSTLRKLI